MHDPHEGVTPQGLIRTGAARDAIEPVWEPVLDAAVAAVGEGSSLYVYGSVATGRAVVPTSDVDLLTVGLPARDAARLSADLSRRFASICRGVAVGPASVGDLTAGTDEGHGLRVFLRHYCVHLAGEDPAASLPRYPADRRAARGFNGDIARYVRQWRAQVDGDHDVAQLGGRIASKTLLAVAGIVSIRDDTWSTDRRSCAVRWDQLEPDVPVTPLVSWLDSPPRDRAVVRRVLRDTVDRVVATFAAEIGLWEGEHA